MLTRSEVWIKSKYGTIAESFLATEQMVGVNPNLHDKRIFILMGKTKKEFTIEIVNPQFLKEMTWEKIGDL